jgi:hypothetical protein
LAAASSARNASASSARAARRWGAGACQGMPAEPLGAALGGRSGWCGAQQVSARRRAAPTPPLHGLGGLQLRSDDWDHSPPTISFNSRACNSYLLRGGMDICSHKYGGVSV